jgi:short-subunit dehydrogenase
MAALKRMVPRDRGTIVQVGSALAYRAIPLQAPYCGAKFAIRRFTDSIRTELLHDKSNVHIPRVHLPPVNTRVQLVQESAAEPIYRPRWRQRPSRGRPSTGAANSGSADRPSR